jgi:glycosyltransferase involved in cell wall biosynthesis
MECLKIAVWHNLPSGGGKRALYDHVRGLVARGHSVEAWCPPTADREFLPLGSMMPEHVVDFAWPVPARRSDKWQITLEIERQIAAMDTHCRRCAEEINRGGFDILFANSSYFLATTSIARFTRIPSVLYLQEPWRHLYEASYVFQYQGMPRLWWLAPPRLEARRRGLSMFRAAFSDLRRFRNSRIQAREEVDNAAAFTRILCNSYFSRESIMRSYGLDSEVCYLGIDTDHFTDRGLPREDFLVGLGSITRGKNLRLAIEAVGAVAPPRPKLVWIGNVSDRDLLREMTELATARDVAFEPMVRIPDAEVVDILNRATAMLYAPRLEPFGLAPLEGNACGLPVIAVAEGGIRETIVDRVNGLLVDHDPISMAKAIERLRANPDLARELGINGRRAIEAKWSLEAATDRIERDLARHALRRTTDRALPLQHAGQSAALPMGTPTDAA